MAAAFYRPLQFIAQNAWDLDSLFKPFLIGSAVGLLGILVMLLLTRLGVDIRAAAIGVATSILILFYWQLIDGVPPLLLLALPVVVTAVTARLARSTLIEGMMFVALAAFGLYPVVQLVLAHLEQTDPYPIVRSTQPAQVSATGTIEDVVFVIVDTYPNILLSETWIGHDTSALREDLANDGLVTPTTAWSQLTFTMLSVSSTLELRPVVLEGPLPPWRNLSSLNQVVKGDNLVAASLQSAGFEYIHIEGGQNGTGCGPSVDLCIPTHWVDETVWLLLGTSVAAGPLEDRYGFYSSPDTLTVADQLEDIGAEVLGDGTRQYVFAYLYLPHPPLVVDDNCSALEDPVFSLDAEYLRTDPGYLAGYSTQLSCVDTLISRIAATVAPSTALLITADHGTGFGGQVQTDGSTWDDIDVAERLSTLLAYHLPTGCEPPVDNVNIDVMRAIMTCATDLELPERDTTVLLGANDPFVVEEERIASIRSGVLDGTINPFDE